MTPPDNELDPQLSVVVPVYNEEQSVEPLLARLLPVLRASDLTFEVLFVDDGSRDGTPELVERLSQGPAAIRLVRLSRNFGHQTALFAGMEHARGAAVLTMDGDLQHPPELIPTLLARWREGYEVVQTIRRDTADAGVAKRITSGGFYRVLSWVSRIRVTPGAADFRLMSRDAVNAFLQCRERSRFNRGLVQWIGFSYCEVPYDAAPRFAGKTKYTLRKMLRLAGDAIFSFSALPLRIAGLAGAVVSIVAAAYLLFVLWAAVFTNRTQPGWTSTLATILVLGGVQLVVLWILGEYIGRMYDEVKQRPMYIVRAQRTGTDSRDARAGELLRQPLHTSADETNCR